MLTNNLLGRGEAAITVPSFDGALKPNQALERAETLFSSDTIEDLATDGRLIYLADGSRILRLDGGGATQVKAFDRPLSAIAISPDGALAAALEGKEVQLFPSLDADRPRAVLASGLNAINALAFAPGGALLATEGSRSRGVSEWAWDLMELGATGRVLALDPASGSSKPLAENLRYAFGVCTSATETLVSESWAHRVVVVGGAGSARIMLPHLPAYPSRLSPASLGGYWLTAFAARTLLVEFVLREPAYRRRMMAEIDPEYWVAPRLRSGESFKEPMQGAHLKTMGVVKPWAPPRSYGLVIRVGADGVPLYSLHSRADGSNHGVVSAIEVGGDLILVAKGPGRVLRLPIAPLDKEFGA